MYAMVQYGFWLIKHIFMALIVLVKFHISDMNYKLIM